MFSFSKANVPLLLVFIVLDANPLENIANTRRIDKVYLRGQEVPRAAMKAKWQAQFRNTKS